jgi:hypothetical protein
VNEEEGRIAEAEQTGNLVGDREATEPVVPTETVVEDPWPVPRPIPPAGGWANFTIRDEEER